jgi:hypothetical protein
MCGCFEINTTLFSSMMERKIDTKLEALRFWMTYMMPHSISVLSSSSCGGTSNKIYWPKNSTVIFCEKEGMLSRAIEVKLC